MHRDIERFNHDYESFDSTGSRLLVGILEDSSFNAEDTNDF